MASWQLRLTLVAAFLAASFAFSTALAADAKRVLLLYSFGRGFKPWSEYAKSVRTELDRQSPWKLEFLEHSLSSALSNDENPEGPFVEYLRTLFAKRPPDLIVSFGAPAAAFVQRHRQQLFATTPMVFTAVEQRRIRPSSLTDNDAVVAVSHDFPAIIENILRVLPDTKTIAVVIGESPNEKFWLGEMRREFAPFADRVSFKWYNDQPFAEILKHAGALPPHSAIYWHGVSLDAAGVAHEGETALSSLYAAANAPIFTFDGSFFGGEIVGGPMHSVLNLSQQTAAAAVRILGGEKAGELKIPVSKFATPIFDWRQLQRWGISESRLPPGSEILFRSPTVWEQYHAYILAVIAAILIQSALISWLFYEHWRRQRAEILARTTMSELTHVNRVATVSQLSASIAHEVRQPLASMLTNAEVALRWLEKANIQEVRESLKDIVSEGFRASDIIANLRAMFKHDVQEKTPIDINKLVSLVLALVVIDLQKHDIELQTHLDEQIPQVLGNQVQLQQVILNLVMNAIEAMSSMQTRVLRIKTELSQSNTVHVSIEDSGAGVKPSDVDRLFKPLFTTKARGMGMGLSICQSIVENHDGRIWVSPGPNGGSIFQFELATTTRKDQAA